MILGAPRHTYAIGVPAKEAPTILVRGTNGAIRHCTPVTRSVAQRRTMVVSDIALHLVYKPAKH